MEKLDLNHGAELMLKPSKSDVSYFYVLFKAGAQSEKYLQLAHLTEHIIVQFDVESGTKTLKNQFMGKYHSDAKTGDDYMRFQFFVINTEQLKERLTTLQFNINNIKVDNAKLETEKGMILTENETYGFDRLTYAKDDLLQSMAEINANDVKDYIKQQLTANNLKVFAISSMAPQTLVPMLNEFVEALPKNGLNNHDVDDDFQWNGKGSKSENNFIPGLNYYDKDLSIPLNVDLKANYEKLNKNILTLKDDTTLTVQISKSFCCTDYPTLAKINALQLFVADFKYGIKRKLRHELGLIYRTNCELLIAQNKTAIITKIFLCKDKTKTIQETKKWFKNLLDNGLTDEELAVLKNNFEYSALTRPNLKDDNQNFYFEKKHYVDYIKSLTLTDFNDFLTELSLENAINIDDKCKLTDEI